MSLSLSQLMSFSIVFSPAVLLWRGVKEQLGGRLAASCSSHHTYTNKLSGIFNYIDIE